MDLESTIDIYKIAEEYNIKLHQVVKNDEYCKANGEDSYINQSYCTNTHIYLGIYEDEDYKIAAFFHELGHIMSEQGWNKNMLKFHIELDAWLVGIQLAMKHGFYIKPNTWKKCMDNYLYSYIDYERRQMINISEEYEKILVYYES